MRVYQGRNYGGQWSDKCNKIYFSSFSTHSDSHEMIEELRKKGLK